MTIDLNIAALYNRAMQAWPEEFRQYMPELKDAQLSDKHYQHCAQQVIERGGPIRIMVIAESPARTPAEILDLPILAEYQAKLQGCFHPNHNNLVHCLSYGEDWLIRLKKEKGKEQSKNPGTHIFWKLLSVLISDIEMESLTEETFLESFPRLKSGATKKQRQARLDYKIFILKQLEKLGIVLVDLSPVSIYLGAGHKTVYHKTTGGAYRTPKASWTDGKLLPILNVAWEDYLKPMLLHYRPESVLILGDRTRRGIPDKDFVATLQRIGATCLGHFPHPSCRTYQGRKYVRFLHAIHRAALGHLHPGKGGTNHLVVKEKSLVTPDEKKDRGNNNGPCARKVLAWGKNENGDTSDDVLARKATAVYLKCKDESNDNDNDSLSREVMALNEKEDSENTTDSLARKVMVLDESGAINTDSLARKPPTGHIARIVYYGKIAQSVDEQSWRKLSHQKAAAEKKKHARNTSVKRPDIQIHSQTEHPTKRRKQKRQANGWCLECRTVRQCKHVDCHV